MLAEFRFAVADHLRSAFTTAIDVWDRIPDDVNALPCMVVGYPEASPARVDNVFDRELTVYVLGRRVDAGDPEGELVNLADQVWTELGGTRSMKHSDAYWQITNISHVTVSVANIDHDAYLFTLESPFVTC